MKLEWVAPLVPASVVLTTKSATPDGLDPHAWQCTLATLGETWKQDAKRKPLSERETEALASAIRERRTSATVSAYYAALEEPKPLPRHSVQVVCETWDEEGWS